MQQAETITQLAERLGVSSRQAEHAIASRRIQPSARVGIIRLFNSKAARQVRTALEQTGALSPNPQKELVSSGSH